jgi:hypothetical protein
VYAFSTLIEPTEAFCAMTEPHKAIPIAAYIVTSTFDFITTPFKD